MCLNMGLNTFGLCHAGNRLNMCLNVALGRMTLRELAQVCLNMVKCRPSQFKPRFKHLNATTLLNK